MSELKSRPPFKNKSDLEAFIKGADEKTVERKRPKKSELLPWEIQGVRSDVIKVYNLRLPEPYLLKLKYISDHTPDSMQKFCMKIMKEAIDSEIDRLLK
jgi:hypothetical protein